jgi:hypothetical protein
MTRMREALPLLKRLLGDAVHSDVVLTATMTLTRFPEDVTRYTPWPSSISLRGADIDTTLGPGSEIFSELAGACLYIPREMRSRTAVAGEPEPEGSETVRTTCAWLIEKRQYHFDMMEAVADKDDARKLDLRWNQHVKGSLYREHPCERAAFDALWIVYEREHMTTMGFADYYGWYVASAATVGPDGKFEQTLADRMRGTLDKWADSGLDETFYWLTRNYEVHPYHEAVARELIDSHAKARTSLPVP